MSSTTSKTLPFTVLLIKGWYPRKGWSLHLFSSRFLTLNSRSWGLRRNRSNIFTTRSFPPSSNSITDPSRLSSTRDSSVTFIGWSSCCSTNPPTFQWIVWTCSWVMHSWFVQYEEDTRHGRTWPTVLSVIFSFRTHHTYLNGKVLILLSRNKAELNISQAY